MFEPMSVGFVLGYEPAGMQLQGVIDLEVVETVVGRFLLVASEATGSFSSILLPSDGSPPSLVDMEVPSAFSGTTALSDLVVVEGPDDRTYVVTLGRYDDNYGVYEMADTGVLTQVAAPTGLPFQGGFVGTSFAGVRGTYLVSANFQQIGLNSFEFGTGGTLAPFLSIDKDHLPIDRVSAMHVGELHGQQLLFTGGVFDEGLTVFLIRPNGNLLAQARMTPYPDNAFTRISDIDSVEIGDRSFVLVAGAGSDTISVLRLSVGMELKLIDREEDTLHTRFETVTDIEVFEAGGRTFVLAAGGDEGVSLFELTYRGKLVHLQTMIDRFDTTLGDISSLEVVVDGMTAHAYVGSSRDHGVTELLIDLERTGLDIRGDAIPERLVGTPGDDVIWGMGRSDELIGGLGDDRLIDGRGRDHLRGGAGEDIFEFLPDGRTDWIDDFQPRIDRIDLTSFDRVYDASAVFVAAREVGAIVMVGDDIIRLVNPRGGPFDVDTFPDDMFIFG